MEPHLNTIQKNTIFDSDKIFLKENTDYLENIFKPVEDIDKAIDKIECGHAKNIINIMALCGISMGILWMIYQPPKSIFGGFVIGCSTLLAGFLVGTMIGILHMVLELPYKSVKVLKNKKDSILKSFSQKLENKDSQIEILLYLSNLQNDPNISDNNNQILTKLKKDIITNFQDKNFKNVHNIIFDNKSTLYRIKEDIKKEEHNESKVNAYLSNLDTKSMSQLNLNDILKNNQTVSTETISDYRTQV